MALQRFLRERWEKELLSYGCSRAVGMGMLNTAEYWRWPWGNYPFTVPIDEMGAIDVWAFQKILTAMAELAPDGYEFPQTR